MREGGVLSLQNRDFLCTLGTKDKGGENENAVRALAHRIVFLELFGEA